jgi:hypothetical protein
MYGTIDHGSCIQWVLGFRLKTRYDNRRRCLLTPTHFTSRRTVVCHCRSSAVSPSLSVQSELPQRVPGLPRITAAAPWLSECTTRYMSTGSTVANRCRWAAMQCRAAWPLATSDLCSARAHCASRPLGHCPSWAAWDSAHWPLNLFTISKWIQSCCKVVKIVQVWIRVEKIWNKFCWIDLALL